MFNNKFRFGINYKEVDIAEIGNNILNINEDGIYYYYVNLIEHVNAVFVHKIGNEINVILYEPHYGASTEKNEKEYENEKSSTYNIINDFLNKNKDKIKYNIDFSYAPEIMLKQTFIPVCYLYSLHFLLTMYFSSSTKNLMKNIKIHVITYIYFYFLNS